MNARLMKEERELLPIFIGTLLLISVPYLIWHESAGDFAYVPFALGCAVLGGCAFGNEFQHRTLPLLLSQPIARSVLWRDKMLILGAGIVVGLAVSAACLGVYGAGSSLAAPLVLALIGLCAFCGAPYWTLVLRQGVGGMAFASAAPGAVLGVDALVTEKFFPDKSVEVSSAILLLILYCAVVYWRGYARFKRLEAFDGAARELSLPAGLEAVLEWPLAKISSRVRGPFGSLLQKEFRLQQVSFLLAGVFFLIAVLGLGLRLCYRDVAEEIVGGDYGFFVLILPLIAGAIAVAEEKGWDLAAWHLTLPPSALQQWSAKMLATFTTSLALGLLLPAAMFLAGAALLNPHGSRASLPPADDLAPWVLGQLLVTSVAVYAASFSKSTLRAILGAFGIIAANIGAACYVGGWAYKVFPALMSVPTPGGISALPILCGDLFLMLCLTQWFAWSNFRRFGLPVRRFVFQLVVIFFAVGLVTLAIIAGLLLTHVGSF